METTTEQTTEQETTSASKPRKLATRLTYGEQREVEALWESGNYTLLQLAKRFNISTYTLQKHFKREDVKRGVSKEKAREVALKQAAIMAEKEAKRKADEHLKRVEETKSEHYSLSRIITKLAAHELTKAANGSAQLGTLGPNFKALDLAISALKKAREERWVVLGLDQDAQQGQSQTELVISELTPEQVEQMRAVQKQQDDFDALSDSIVSEEINVEEMNVD